MAAIRPASPVAPPSVTGAPPTFDDFYRDRYQAAVRLAHVLVGSVALAEDLAQEAFLAVYPRYHELERPGAYLRTTVVNLARSHHRRRGRHDRAVRLLPPPADGVLGAQELLDAVDGLPYREKAVLVLRYWLDLPEPEIAQIVGCRPATVRTTAARALRRLRKELDR